MKTVPILFTIDDKLVLPACVCISSLMRSASEGIFYDIFVIHSRKYDLAHTGLAEMPDYYKNCSIHFRPIGEEFVGAYEIRGIPETCYYRMLSPELIPEYDKILYSDVDVIFREDLSKYYDLDLGTNCFGGVDNCSVLRPAVRKYLRKEVGINPENGYYYSGNLIINLKQIREEHLCNDFRFFGKRNFRQQDMDIINIVCNKRFLPLPLAYCLTVNLYSLMVNRRTEMLQYYSEEEIDYALKYGTVHYNGAKPWNGWCHHFDIWWEAYRNSPFFDEKYYADFYFSKEDELDRLTLTKRLKMVARYFVFGRKK